MSIALMTAAFQRVNLPPNKKIILLRMADAADDNGRGVYLSVRRIAHECGISKRTVQNVLREFERDRVAAIDANYVGGRGKSRVYRIDIDRAQELHPLLGWARAKEGRDRGSPGAEKSTAPAPEPLEEPNQQTTGSPLRGSPRTRASPAPIAQNRSPDGSNPEKEKYNGTKRGTRLDPHWRPAAQHFVLGQQLGFGRDRVELETDKFLDHWCAKAGNDARKLDWDRTFNNWLRNARDFDQRAGRGAQNQDAGRIRHEPPSVVAAVRHILDQC